MLWLQLIGGVLMFGTGVLLLSRAGTTMSKASQPDTTTRPSSSPGVVDLQRWRATRRAALRKMPRRRRARSFDEEFARLTEQLRDND